MKTSDYVIQFIVQEGVGHIFEFIGGAITHLLDSTYGRKDIQCVSVHHEQTGAFAAEAYARMNNNLGVAMATSGPGALNMVTGIIRPRGCDCLNQAGVSQLHRRNCSPGIWVVSLQVSSPSGFT